MRRWYKYEVAAEPGDVPLAAAFDDVAETMGGYEAAEGYESRDAFFQRYHRDYQYGRPLLYDSFLDKHLRPGMEVLSVASGRCANELRLAEAGVSVTCSDLAVPPHAEATERLFPGWRFEVLDVLAGPAEATYDAVMAIGLIYLFDEAQLDRFLRHVYASLRPGGLLILDSAGSPDNLLSLLIHDVVLRLEAREICRRARRKGPAGVVRRHHGYRRTDEEILAAASAAGFTLRDYETAGFLWEFRRSLAFGRFVRRGSRLERAFERLGRRVPYVRMFALERR